LQTAMTAAAPTPSAVVTATAPPSGPAGADLPELREHIRARRAALAGFMEQGAALALDGEVLRVFPRNDIYIRYLNDNRASIAELASELYGRQLRVEVSLNGAPADAGAARAVGAADAVQGASTGGASAAVAGAAAPAAGLAGAEQGAAPVDDSGGPSNGAPTPPPVSAEAAAARDLVSDRQALYADPIVRRIFEEFQGRLVEVREIRDPSAKRTASPSEIPSALGVLPNDGPAAPAIRRPPQE